MKKAFVLLIALVSYSLLTVYSINSLASTDPIQNLSATSGSEFVRLEWDDTQVEVDDYIVSYRQKNLSLSGSIDPDGSDIVVGVGTSFTSEIHAGAALHLSGETRYVIEVVSDNTVRTLNAFPDLPNDTSPEFTPIWTSFEDGVSTNSNAVVQGLTNDIEYEFMVKAQLPPSQSGKTAGQPRYSQGKVVSETPYLDGYDIIVLAGQSNMVGQAPYDSVIDTETWRIRQLGNHGINDNQIIDAGDPLENRVQPVGRMGFAMQFSRLYRNSLLDDNREVLLVPTAAGGTGFSDNEYWGDGVNWGVGGELSDDLIARANTAFTTNPHNEFVAFLWAQGGNEAIMINNGEAYSQQDYENDWLAMMDSYDIQISGFDSSVPVIVGEISPGLTGPGRDVINNALDNLSNLRLNTSFASSDLPFPLTLLDLVHFDRPANLEFAQRYFNELMRFYD